VGEPAVRKLLAAALRPGRVVLDALFWICLRRTIPARVAFCPLPQGDRKRKKSDGVVRVALVEGTRDAGKDGDDGKRFWKKPTRARPG